MIGKVLDNRYRVLSQLGQGGMGSVYLAEHAILGKRMAVKVLRPEYSSRDDLVQRFKQEAVTASQIGHENIVDVTDFGKTPEGELYFVMEAIPGESLAAILARDGAIPQQRALPMLSQLCGALGAAHSRGIVHRDLKTDNVMVVRRDDGTDLIKVLDFGISKMTAAQNSRITQAGAIMGTPHYMAPEQATTSQVDHRADIYSFGVVAYEMVTGMLPFEAETDVRILMMHQTQAPEPPTRRRPDLRISPALEEIILRALAKRPEDRQQSMVEIGAQITALIGQLGFAPLRSPTMPPAAIRPITSPQAIKRGGTLSLSDSELASPVPPAVAPDRMSTQEMTALEEAAIRRGPNRAVLIAILLVAASIGAGAWWMNRTPAAESVAVVETPPPPPRVEPPPAPVQQSPPSAPPAPTMKTLSLSSIPRGAAVFADDRELGTTPLTVQLAAGSQATYLFKLDGHQPLTKQVAAEDGTVEVRLSRTRRGHKKGDEPYGKVDDLKNPFQ